jgi:hypothetical protein
MKYFQDTRLAPRHSASWPDAWRSRFVRAQIPADHTAKCLPTIFTLEPTPLDRYVVFMWFYEPCRDEKVQLTY